MAKQVSLYTDGGSRGNPGPAAAAFIIKDRQGKQLLGRALFLGRTTNNAAEYAAVRAALLAAKEMGAEEIHLFSDSELLVRQLQGQYRVKSENILGLYSDCVGLLNSFESWKVQHIKREFNADADRLANRAMDARATVDLPAEPAAKTGKRLRLGILLSGGGRTMVNLHKEIQAGRLNAQIVVVISSLSKVAGVERAREIGIEPIILRRKDFSDVGGFSAALADALDKARVDLVIQAGWLCLWKIPQAYANRVMNVHPALLPSFGGQGMWGHHVHEAVLKAGCKVSGCTVHFCTNDYDAGPIIVQRCCEVKDGDTAETLAARVFEEECRAYPEAIRLFSEDRLKVVSGVVVRQ
ncbi:MAG: phosphoribosylglycinamide formyltransferase [Planctomycetaceae bacterium]|nr:phosphoribosylglycinamide formyltransferase [Planctomycetaceae bacterium]